MSRWISKERVINDFKKYVKKGYAISKTDYEGYMKIVVTSPSIDIVRCWECKQWQDDRKDERDMGTCGLTHYFTDRDDFCSYGEREEQ